ncbi:MAG: hypothetical protein DRP22_01170 [Verrucomicrobia bacterium]|nr:MAG: hypothetical protein DRP22_01170 [Verrucomicrobiota bacterium]
MDKDISGILEGWEYDPRRVTARWIRGHDGRPKVQLRLDLGLFQMEAEGRPDGATPHGFASLLEFYRDLEQSLPASHPALTLNEEACSDLQQEAVQYYCRYIAFYALGYLDGVIRDTQHNLDIMSLVERRAADPELAWQVLQFYPYVRMMNARAAAEKAEADGDIRRAVALLEEAVGEIRQFWATYGDEDTPESELDEMMILQELLDRLRSKLPVSPIQMLQERLDRALREEDYEQAAVIRDRIRRLEQGGSLVDEGEEEAG